LASDVGVASGDGRCSARDARAGRGFRGLSGGGGVATSDGRCIACDRRIARACLCFRRLPSDVGVAPYDGGCAADTRTPRSFSCRAVRSAVPRRWALLATGRLPILGTLEPVLAPRARTAV
jgi:hypothetical protein